MGNLVNVVQPLKVESGTSQTAANLKHTDAVRPFTSTALDKRRMGFQAWEQPPQRPLPACSSMGNWTQKSVCLQQCNRKSGLGTGRAVHLSRFWYSGGTVEPGPSTEGNGIQHMHTAGEQLMHEAPASVTAELHAQQSQEQAQGVVVPHKLPGQVVQQAKQLLDRLVSCERKATNSTEELHKLLGQLPTRVTHMDSVTLLAVLDLCQSYGNRRILSAETADHIALAVENEMRTRMTVASSSGELFNNKAVTQLQEAVVHVGYVPGDAAVRVLMGLTLLVPSTRLFLLMRRWVALHQKLHVQLPRLFLEQVDSTFAASLRAAGRRTARAIDVAVMLWALSRLGYCPADLDLYGAKLMSHMHQLTGVLCVNAMLAFAAIQRLPESVKLDHLFSHFVQDCLTDCNAQTTALFLYAYTKVVQQGLEGWRPEPAGLATILQHFSRQLPNANLQNVNNVLSAVAQLKPDEWPLGLDADAIGAVTMKHLPHATPAQLAQLMHSLAMLGHVPATMDAATVGNMLRTAVPTMDGKALSMTVWALAKLQAVPAAVDVQRLCESCSAVASSVRDVTELLHSLACLSAVTPLPPSFMLSRAQASLLKRNLRKLSPMDLGVLIGALGTLFGTPPPAHACTLHGAVLDTLPTGTTLSADSTWPAALPSTTLSAAMMRMLDICPDYSLSRCLWGLALSGHTLPLRYYGKLWKRVSQVAVPSADDISRSMWALALMSRPTYTVTDYVSLDRLLEHQAALESLGAAAAARTLESLTMLRYKPPKKAFRRLWFSACTSRDSTAQTVIKATLAALQLGHSVPADVMNDVLLECRERLYATLLPDAVRLLFAVTSLVSLEQVEGDMLASLYASFIEECVRHISVQAPNLQPADAAHVLAADTVLTSARHPNVAQIRPNLLARCKSNAVLPPAWHDTLDHDDVVAVARVIQEFIPDASCNPYAEALPGFPPALLRCDGLPGIFTLFVLPDSALQFVCTTPRHVLGHVALTEWALESRGFGVLRLPVNKWRKCESYAHQRALVRTMLEKGGIVR